VALTPDDPLRRAQTGADPVGVVEASRHDRHPTSPTPSHPLAAAEIGS
jgi:hypothetical protein